MPLEHGRTLLAHGRVLRRLKRKRLARDALVEADRLFTTARADALRLQAAADVRPVVVRLAPDELSPTELRNAQLAASGRTDPAHAHEVFLTANAVRAH